MDTVAPSKIRRIAREWGINYPIALASSSLQAQYDILDAADDGRDRTRRSGQGHPCVGVMSERLNNATQD